MEVTVLKMVPVDVTQIVPVACGEVGTGVNIGVVGVEDAG